MTGRRIEELSMGAKVLVIEDEETMLEGILYNLNKEGFDAYAARDGEAGVAKARLIRPDLVLLDLMLPGIDGLDVPPVAPRRAMCRHHADGENHRDGQGGGPGVGRG